MKTNTTLIKIASVFALVATVAINILANALPLGGLTTGQISALYPTLITPPGVTFAIWGVIYLMLGIFLVSQLISRKQSDLADFYPYFLLSCIANIAWIFFWHTQMIILATISIAILLFCLVMIYIKTRNRNFVTRTAFSLYYAWITVASIVSVFVLVKYLAGAGPLTFSGIVGAGFIPRLIGYSNIEYICATAAALIVGPLTMLHIFRREDYVYAFVMLWATGGIMYKQATSVNPPLYMLIAAGVSVLVIIISCIVRLTSRSRCTDLAKCNVNKQ